VGAAAKAAPAAAAKLGRAERLLSAEVIERLGEVISPADVERILALPISRREMMRLRNHFSHRITRELLAPPTPPPGLPGARPQIDAAALARVLAEVDPADLRPLLASAHKLAPNLPLGQDIARYLATLDPALATREIGFAQRALEAEILDGGHSILRHGPQVSDEALKARLTTGVAPDGLKSPAAHSTKFNTFEEWWVTRERAFVKASEIVDLSSPPAAADLAGAVAKASKTGSSTIEFALSRFSADHFDLPRWAGFSTTMIGRAKPISLLFRSETKIVWLGSKHSPASGRWAVVQHFPTADGFTGPLAQYHKPPDHAWGVR
jgi:hypothetical protein